MMYGPAFLWSVCWIYTDSNLTAMIHSKSSWAFLPRVAPAKTRRRRTKGVSGSIWFDSAGSMRSPYDSILYHLGRGYAVIYVLCLFSGMFHHCTSSIHTFLSYYSLFPIPYYSLNMGYKINAKLAIGQLQFVTHPPIGGRYLISDVTNVVRLRI